MCRFVICVLLFCIGAPAWQESPRYLYVVSCDARVDKLDTLSGEKVGSYHLAQETGAEQLIPEVKGNRTFDGCLANEALYDAKASIFYTVIPEQAQSKPNGTKDYRVLGFNVPDLTVAKRMVAGTGLEEPPHLEIRSEQLRIVRQTEWSPETDLDISGFIPDKKNAPNQTLEQSGGTYLLDLFTDVKSGLVLSIANRRTASIVQLKKVPSTTAKNVHLAPGGGAVLVEETSGDDGAAAKTGTVALFDTKTGVQVSTVSDPRVKDLFFLAISPNGKAIFHSGKTYWFLSLNAKFTVQPVTRPVSSDFPALFFANK